MPQVLTAKPLSDQEPLRLSLPARTLRICSSILFLLLCVALCGAGWFWFSLPDVSSLADPQTSITITVRDWQGQEHPFVLGPKNPDWTPLADFPEQLPWAVIVAEDGGFYSHRGFDPEAIREALIYDFEQGRMARGASTITQQLAKNLFLSRDKTLTRKLRELAIAWQLERHLGKKRILELYLNLVELGPMVHGMTAGARYHFGKPVGQLSAAEGAFLAAILPGPRVAFNPEKHPHRVRERAAALLHFMRLRRILSEEALTEANAALTCLGSVSSTQHETDIHCTAGIPKEKAPVRDELSPRDGAPSPWQLPLSEAS